MRKLDLSILLLLLGTTSVASGPLLGQEENKAPLPSKTHTTASPRGSHRILFVSDPSSIATNLLPDPVEEHDLRRWVDILADSGVDMFNQEIYSQGWTAYWKSETIAYDQRIQHRRFLPMIGSGSQPVEVLIDQSHHRGMIFIAGFRVNDNHAYQAKGQGVGIAKFIEEHPEWTLKGFPDQPYYKLSEPLDFTFQGPRDFFHSVIEQAVTRFDVDGIELCFRDHGYFPHGTGRERKDLMTELVRRIRATVDSAGQEKGKKLLIGARVFSTLDECLFLGLDVPTWTSEGLVDYLSPQDTMYADFNAPYHEFAALTRGYKCMLYPATLPWTSNRARNRLRQIPLSSANSRAMAHTFYGAGADGISIYNHFVTMGHPPFYPQSMQIFRELRDPQKVAAGRRHYVFDPTWGGHAGFGMDRCSTGAIKATRLVLDRTAPGAADQFRFHLYEDMGQVRAAILLFRGFGLREDDQLKTALNGQIIPDESIRKIAREEGRIDFRAEGEPPFTTRWFALNESNVVRGENELNVTLIRSSPEGADPIVIDELEIWVDPT